MPQVDAFTLAGITCWFWSHDHYPPHFHARKPGHWEVKVYFMEADQNIFEMVYELKRMHRGDRKDILRAVRNHREALLIEWELKTDNRTGL